jgi:cobalt-zinc-cadmium resistance protein CzcA
MFERILRFSIEQRWLVMLAVLGMSALGVFSYQKLPIDAVPDITNVQVQINTAMPGFSPDCLIFNRPAHCPVQVFRR